MSTDYQRRRVRRDKGLPNWRIVRYADLCRTRHKSAYADHRIMPPAGGSVLVEGSEESFRSA